MEGSARVLPPHRPLPEAHWPAPVALRRLALEDEQLDGRRSRRKSQRDLAHDAGLKHKSSTFSESVARKVIGIEEGL